MSINVIIFIEFGIVGDLIGMIANIERLRGYELDLYMSSEGGGSNDAPACDSNGGTANCAC